MGLTSPLEDGRSDVLIVGAGPVGLSAAIELGRRGIRCCVVERHDRVGYSPRAKTTNVRTREHLRRWGIADALRKASPIAADRPSTVVFATRMNGPLLARFENALNGNRERNNLYSEEAQWVPQYVLEDVLRECAQSLPGVRVHFETEFASFSQTEAAVASQVCDLRTGRVLNIESCYLIGADGARSAVRDAISAAMLGEGASSRNYSIIFRAPDLAARQIHEPAIMYWMVNEDVPSLLGPMDEAGLWFFMATKLAGDVDPATLDPIDLIRRGTGLSDLDIEIVGTDVWVAHRLVADRYSRGRVFLAGDACHLHPPFGGFGMNMGIGDAVDLGWKIAARMEGWGGDRLLGTYEEERRKVHERTINEAVYNYGSTANQLVRPALEERGLIGEATRREVADIIQATKVREFRTLGVVLGMRYEDSPIIVADGSDPPMDHFMLYVPSAHPGCLAPHLWLADGSSLYDHFGEGFTLLITGGHSDAAGPLVAAAAKRKIPLKVLALSDSRLCSRYEAAFALIRPDQHVAWRAESMPRNPDYLLARVTGASEHCGGHKGANACS
jgi:2-polyprenyl-6-methoxyphenol hydroxylase-like FAD-dependent oxidoreductase